MGEADKPDTINVENVWALGDPETCMHCRVKGWLAKGITDELGGKIEVAEFLGALISCAADMIADAPTRQIRKATLASAIKVLREESKPEAPDREHVH